MNGSSIHNFDVCEDPDPIYFDSYKEFQTWLEANHGKDCKQFIDRAIAFNTEAADNSFDRWWKAVDWFTSGNVCYKFRQNA